MWDVHGAYRWALTGCNKARRELKTGMKDGGSYRLRFGKSRATRRPASGTSIILVFEIGKMKGKY